MINIMNYLLSTKIVSFIILFLLYLSNSLIEWKITTTAQKLGLDSEEWNYLIELFDIKLLNVEKEK